MVDDVVAGSPLTVDLDDVDDGVRLTAAGTLELAPAFTVVCGVCVAPALRPIGAVPQSRPLVPREPADDVEVMEGKREMALPLDWEDTEAGFVEAAAGADQG